MKPLFLAKQGEKTSISGKNEEEYSKAHKIEWSQEKYLVI